MPHDPHHLIELPFLPRWEAAMLGGVKTCTCRTSKKGGIGDRFVAFGRTFVLTSVWQVRLEEVAKQYYRQEGVASPEEYVEVWKGLHKKKGWVPDQVGWLHSFRLHKEGGGDGTARQAL